MPKDNSPFFPEVADLAFQYRHQSLYDLLTPVLRLPVYEATKLRNGNGNTDVLHAAYQFRN